MKAEAEQHVQALGRILAEAVEHLSADDMEPTREKYAGVARSIDELQRLGVDVPDALAVLLDQLRARLDEFDEARGTLEYLRMTLTELGSQAEAALPARQRRGGRLDGDGVRGHREPSLRPRGFIVDGTHYRADSWTDLVREVARVMASRHPDDFDRVLTLRNNRGRPLFSRNPADLDRPLSVEGTDIFMFGRLSGDRASHLAVRLAEFFGYDQGQFSVLEPD